MKTYECQDCGMRFQIQSNIYNDIPRFCPNNNCKSVDKIKEIQLKSLDRPMRFDGYGDKKNA